MSITAKQALKAIHWLQESKDSALLAHHSQQGTAQELHIEDLEKCFAHAATELGFKLVKVEGNHLRVVGGDGQ